MFTPRHNKFGAMDEGKSPRTPLSFSRELRQVLQERNLLTTKTRTKVCTMLESSPLSSPNPEAGKRKSFRQQAIQEIISSERSYLAQLELLMSYFVLPLKALSIIDGANHTALFGQIEMIHNLNGEFLRELETSEDNVAPAFLKMAPFFKLYSVYAFDYRSALFLLQDLTSKNPCFRKFLEQTESRPEVQRKLNSLMIVPIQRVPRYKLLLEQVILYTSPADEDFKALKESVKQIEATASHINSCVEDQEVTQYLIHLQNSLVNRTPNIVKPSRRVIKEGVLNKVTRTGSEIKRYCVLMSDIFMYCKILKDRPANTVVDNSLECCCIFPLKKCKVYELFPGNFKLTCQGDGIIFGTTDFQLGRTWVGFIRDAIELHIQCRKTLRKESSKRTPIRKKDMKKFDEDYVLSPNKRKCDYETVFRNKNRSTDSEDEPDDDDVLMSYMCFPRKRKIPKNHMRISALSNNQNLPKQINNLKRPARPPPPPPPPLFLQLSPKRCQPPPPPPPMLPVDGSASHVELRSNETENNKERETRFSKLYKMISTEKMSNVRSILKRTPATTTVVSARQELNLNHEHDPTYGFVSLHSDTKSYFRAHNVDNTIPTAVKREDLFNADNDPALGDGNFRDVLYPLRLSGASQKNSCCSGWSVPSSTLRQNKENVADTLAFSPPQKKRVKFDNNIDTAPLTPAQPYAFARPLMTTQDDTKAATTLRDRIYDFFANLF